MLKCMKSHWKRTVSGLLAVIMAAGMLPVSAHGQLRVERGWCYRLERR